MGCGSSSEIDYAVVASRIEAKETSLTNQANNQYTGEQNGQIPKPTVVKASPAPEAQPKSIPPESSPHLEEPKPFTSSRRQKYSRKRSDFGNVYVTPLKKEDVVSFQAPRYSKSNREAEFLESTLKHNFVFGHLTSRQFSTLMDAFEKAEFEQDAIIAKQNDIVDYSYVIFQGVVRFEVNGRTIGSASAGQTFGEYSLLYTSPHNASCIAEQPCILYRVDQKTFRYILQQQTHFANADKLALLKQVPFLEKIEAVDLEKLAAAMMPRRFEKGEYLMRKGEVADRFYLIQEGNVQITETEIGGMPYGDVFLGSGDFFGERAIVQKEQRYCSAVGITDGLVLCIELEKFEKTMGDLDRLILKATDRRLLSGIKAIQTTKLDQIDLVSLAALFVDDHYSEGLVLFEQDEEVDSTFYIVREGKVILNSTDPTYDGKVIQKGGYFGDEMLTRDAQFGIDSDGPPPKSIAAYGVRMLEQTCVACLTLEECRTVIDTTRIGKERRSRRFQSIKDCDIELKALKKHQILGAGTFGQVWLVSRLASDGKTRVPYALKIQSKHELVKHQQVKGVVQERAVLSQLQHTFITKLVNTYQDRGQIYMLMPLVQGGELFSLIHPEDTDGIPESNAKFYAAGILEGLSYMHRRHILYRDLKPENILIDDQGYPVIVDMGFAKYVTEKTYTLCGTPLYIAPEVILNRGHDKGADHWSLGILVYEMISGVTPFYEEGMEQLILFEKIVDGKFEFPTEGKVLSATAEDLVLRLLVVDPSQRLGSLARGEKDIYNDPFFADIKFDAIRRRHVRSPWVPTIKDALDTSNFDEYNHLRDKCTLDEPSIPPSDDKLFMSF